MKKKKMIFTNIFLRFFENSSGELSLGNTPHLYLNIFILKLGRKIIYDFRNLISLNLCSINIFLFSYFYFKSLWLTYQWKSLKGVCIGEGWTYLLFQAMKASECACGIADEMFYVI
jgi:hypothetical protein